MSFPALGHLNIGWILRLHCGLLKGFPVSSCRSYIKQAEKCPTAVLAQLSSVRHAFLQGLAVGYTEGKMLSCVYTILVPFFCVWLCCVVLCGAVVALAVLTLAV